MESSRSVLLSIAIPVTHLLIFGIVTLTFEFPIQYFPIVFFNLQQLHCCKLHTTHLSPSGPHFLWIFQSAQQVQVLVYLFSIMPSLFFLRKWCWKFGELDFQHLRMSKQKKKSTRKNPGALRLRRETGTQGYIQSTEESTLIISVTINITGVNVTEHLHRPGLAPAL